MELLDRMMQGDRRALARLMTRVENDEAQARNIVKAIYPSTGKAVIIGVTGSPGVGKSTLVDKLAAHYLTNGKSVGILAVDPTSAFTGGAILGDRIRLTEADHHERLFFRSLASRGSLGGVSRATGDMMKLLDAFGKDIIIVETVGTGQSEIDIVHYAHTVLVVMAPGYGDEVQAFKAGIMEIGDVFIVNKADQGDSERTISQLHTRLSLQQSAKDGWTPPIVKAVASDNRGIEEIAATVEQHYRFVSSDHRKPAYQKARIQYELSQLMKYEVEKQIMRHSKEDGRYQQVLQDVIDKRLDPYEAVRILTPAMINKGGNGFGLSQ